ncbi:MAG TPA: hypothetical protein VJM51_04230 [Dehalococcoidia bacterium]|nr:hypothetical protein [Dehalococcoidia bacterium]HLE82440.1 hypothetical protein [Dehalococcoidia bacterium]
MDATEATALSNALQFVEEEQRQYKTQIFKFQQQLEQLQGTLWTLGDRVNTLEGAIATVMAHGSRVARLEEDLRQTREFVEHFQSEFEARHQQETTGERLIQTELERERQARTELLQKLDDLERNQAGTLEKLQTIEEVGRRRQEELHQLERSLEPFRVRDDQLSQQIAGSYEAQKRQAQELAELQQEQKSLQAQDEVVQGRVQHLADQVRRLESEESLQNLEQRLTAMLVEQNELHRAERQRLERTSVELQMSYEQYRSMVDDLQQQMLQLQGKAQAVTQYLEQVREQFWELRNALGEQFTKIVAAEEQHRRRQITELEQQIKDLRVWNPETPRS